MAGLMRASAITLAATIGVLSVTEFAQSAVVTFSAPTDIANGSNGEEVSTTGTYAFAYNVGDDSIIPTLNINGVTFHSSASAATPSGITITNNVLASGGVILNDRMPAGPPHNFGANFNTLMTSAFLSNSDSSFDLTLNGLTIGTPYRVQFLHGEGTSSGRPMTVSSGGNTTPQFDPAGGDAGEGFSKYVLADFTADATTQTFTFASPSSRAVLNAVSIFVVPEPSALGLIGLAGIAAMRRRSR